MLTDWAPGLARIKNKLARKRFRRERLADAMAVADEVEFSLPSIKLEELFPGMERSQVVMLPRLIRVHTWGMPESELLILGAITRGIAPMRVFEFGTFQGGSTLVMASNSPDRCRLITLDVDPSSRKDHHHGLGVGLLEFDVGKLFKGTRFQSKIEQRFGNSLDMDFSCSEWQDQFDFVFVDADHTYTYAKRDTESALSMVKDGGWILWHDYRWNAEDRECAGVTKSVNEFHAMHGECWQIEGSRFAIHRVKKN